MMGDSTFLWESPQNARDTRFGKDEVLYVAVSFYGSYAKCFEDLTEDEIDSAVLFITEQE